MYTITEIPDEISPERVLEISRFAVWRRLRPITSGPSINDAPRGTMTFVTAVACNDTVYVRLVGEKGNLAVLRLRPTEIEVNDASIAPLPSFAHWALEAFAHGLAAALRGRLTRDGVALRDRLDPTYEDWVRSFTVGAETEEILAKAAPPKALESRVRRARCATEGCDEYRARTFDGDMCRKHVADLNKRWSQKKSSRDGKTDDETPDVFDEITETERETYDPG